jgi:hypothetical protein
VRGGVGEVRGGVLFEVRGRWESEREGSWRGTEFSRTPSEGCKEPLVQSKNTFSAQLLVFIHSFIFIQGNKMTKTWRPCWCWPCNFLISILYICLLFISLFIIVSIIIII